MFTSSKRCSLVLFLFLLLAAFATRGVAQQISQVTTFTSTATGASLNLTNTGVTYYKLRWTVTGTLNTCTLLLNGSNDNTYTDGVANPLGSQTCTSSGSAMTSTAIAVNYIRANATIGTGGGTLTVTVMAYNDSPSTGGASSNVAVTNTPAVTQSGGPWTINQTQQAGVTLGAPSTYGTSPGAVAVPGVNASVTNTPTVQPGNTPNTTPWLFVNPNVAGADDPCANSHVIKTSKAIADLAASAKLISTGGGSTQIYVCGWSLTATGTAPTFKFQQGTGTVCATGLLQISGTYLPTPGAPFSSGNAGQMLFAAAAAQDVCLAITGTSPVIAGLITYVIQ